VPMLTFQNHQQHLNHLSLMSIESELLLKQNFWQADTWICLQKRLKSTIIVWVYDMVGRQNFFAFLIQRQIQPLRLGGISVIFHRHVSSRVKTTPWAMKNTSQHCYDKPMDGKIALKRNCCFPNCTKSWLIYLLS